MDLDGTDISLSVIILCDDQWEFILDAIASVEVDLETVDEILIATSHFLDSEEQEILNYLSSQGYIICQVPDDFHQAEVLNFCIQKASGKYILPLRAENKICSDTILTALEILDAQSEVGVIYGDLKFFGQESKIQLLPDFSLIELVRQNFINLSSIFRKKVWEDCGGFDENISNPILCEWEFWLKATTKNWSFFHLTQVLLEKRTTSRQQNLECNEKLNQEHPLVSVCIPTYNGERFIAEAISSILSQTYSPLELIISDDASLDKTVEIAQKYKEITSIPISLFSHEPLGLAENCNFAISQARGKYVKFLFQDDLLSPNCIAEMVQLAEQDKDIGFVFSPRQICFVDQIAETDPDLISIEQDFQNLHQAWLSLKSIQWGQELLNDSHLFKHPINKIGEPSTVLIRREVLEQVGGFDPSLNQLVDLDLWLRIMGTYKVGFVNQVLSYFRLHTQQKTYQNISENVSTDLKFYYKVYAHPVYHFLPEFLRHRALCIYTINLNHFYLYFSDNNSGTFLEDLRLLRQEVAEYWLQLTPEKFNQTPSSSLRTVYNILLRNQRFRQEPLTESEQRFVKDIVNTISSSSGNFQEVGEILALMLYQNPTQHSFTSDIIPLPYGLYKEVLNWLKTGVFNLDLSPLSSRITHSNPKN
ncbi:glycosyltransferase [Limnoraphis robusta]|uniref:glycosyltransferase n=1 Tax=Limnoraphis robusta TaxID=1118279 RepID=UPI0007C7BC26|nr:glycosyltransferase [Limnoraphis robusta]